MTVIAYTDTLVSPKNTYFHWFYVNEYFGMLNDICLREWINEYFAHLCSLLPEHQDKWHIVTSGLECFISTFMWKWGNTLFLFAILCCTGTTCFHSFALPPGVRLQNVFCSKSHLKCSWFPNFKPSFQIGIDGYTTFQYLGDGMLSGQTFHYFDGGGKSAICVRSEHKLHL
jgi:hypothetical protein